MEKEFDIRHGTKYYKGYPNEPTKDGRECQAMFGTEELENGDLVCKNCGLVLYNVKELRAEIGEGE